VQELIEFSVCIAFLSEASLQCGSKLRQHLTVTGGVDDAVERIAPLERYEPMTRSTVPKKMFDHCPPISHAREARVRPIERIGLTSQTQFQLPAEAVQVSEVNAAIDLDRRQFTKPNGSVDASIDDAHRATRKQAVGRTPAGHSLQVSKARRAAPVCSFGRDR